MIIRDPIFSQHSRFTIQHAMQDLSYFPVSNELDHVLTVTARLEWNGSVFTLPYWIPFLLQQQGGHQWV